MALQDFGSLSLTNTPTGAQDKAPGLGSPRRGGTTPLDAATVDRIIAEEGAGAVKPTVLGIYGQETNGGTNARTSVDGAIGGMQVMPNTFKRLAKPGERIDNPEDNFRVGVRYLKTMADQFGNDPARLAVGYFSGEGNVNISGDTPYKEDRRDGNGKSVSSYVRDLVGRVGNAAVPSAKAAQPAPDISKTPKYRDFIAKPQWGGLDATQKEQARNTYFDRYVAPHLPAAEQDGQRDAFLRRALEIEGPAPAAAAQQGILSRAAGGLADAGRAVLGAIGQGEAGAEGAAIDPTALRTPASSTPNKIGVMGTASAPAPVTSTTSRAPVTPEFRDQVSRAYDAATPAERERMAQADGVVGQLVRERSGQFAAAPATPTAGKLDTRAEARAGRLAADGADHLTADRFARTGAERGVTPGAELGTIGQTEFDFAAQQAFNKGPLSHPAIRAAVKGYEGFKVGSLGLAQAAAELTGANEAAETAQRGIKTSLARTGAIGDSPDALQRNFEGAVSSIAQQLPALLGGAATGAAAVPLAAMFAQTFGQEYAQTRAQGIDPGQAAARAGIFGAFEVIGERFGLGNTLHALKLAARGGGTADIASTLAKGLLKEIPGEQLTTLGQFLTDKVPGLGTNLEAGLAQYLQQAGDTLAQTVMQGGLMMGGTTGVAAGVRHMQGAQSQATQEVNAEAARDSALNKAANFFQPARPKHASQVAAEQVVRDMAADAGMDAADLLPPERTAPPAPAAAPAPAPVAAPTAQDQSDADDMDGLSDAVLAAEAAQGVANEGQLAVPAAVVDPRGATPDAGMGADPAVAGAGAVPGGDAAGAGAGRDAAAGGAAVLGADGAADGQSALSDLYGQAVDVVRKTRSPSISIIQRHLRIGYSRAAGMLDQMERDGVVSAPNVRGIRSVLDQAPAATPLDAAAQEAATSPTNDLPEPTDAQKAAGNYKMGHATVNGLDITIENPRGSQRSGTDAAGKAWSVDMANHYGYIKRTEGADGDHVDAFIGPNPDSAQVFVVDQVDPRTGKFDEHKVMMGFDSLEAAREGYHANYEKGWKGAGAITPMSMDDFKAWLKGGDTTKPLNPKVGKPRTEAQARAAREQAKPQAPADSQARADLDSALADLGDILGAKPAAAPVPPAKPKSEKVLKEERAAKKRTGAQAARDKLKAENPFLAFIGEFGLNPKDRKDLGQEKGQRAIPGYGFVWRNSAPRVDELALLAMESGFLSQDDIDAAGDTGGTRKLAEMIQRAMTGEVEQTHDTAIEAAQGRQESEYQEYLLQQREAEQEAADERDAILYAERAAFDVIDDPDIPFDLSITTDPAHLTDDEIDRLFGLPAESRGGIQEDSAAPAGESAGNPATPARAGPGGGQEQGLTGAADEAPLLTSYSADDVRAQESQREEAAKTEAKAKREADERTRREQEKKELGDRRRQDASAENFELGQDPMEALSGQADIFGAPAAAPSEQDTPQIRRARADLAAALGDLGDILTAPGKKFITPEQEQKLLPVMTRLFDAAFRLGYYKFKQSARFVLDTVREKFGDDVAGLLNLDYLQAGYISMAGRYQEQGADSKRDVINVESLDEITENDDVSAPGGIPQPGSETRNPQDGVDAAPVRNGSGATERGAGGAGQGAAGGRGNGQGGRVVPDAGPAAGGKRGDQQVSGRDGQYGDGENAPRSGDGRGSRSAGGSGVQSDAAGNAKAEADAERARRLNRDEKLAAQSAAESIPVVAGDRANIDATLPFLNEGQREDLHFGETRFQKPDGYGVLYTNGTGTGKTFLGLGYVKRMVKQGKGNGLIVAPNEAVIAGWVESAKDLGLTLSPLESTKDAGRGVAITTYANFATNPTLADRDYDFVVIDEAQELMKSKDANETGALAALRAITLHPGGVLTRAKMQQRDLLAKIVPLRAQADELRKQAMRTEQQNADLAKLEAKIKPLQAQYDEAVEKVRTLVVASQNASRPRALFLSATPFAYEQNVDWAAGYLFSYPEVVARGYNTPSPYGKFMMQHFGWRMRTGKLTEPDAKVDRNIMQRQFNTWLRREGVLSARMLDVDADYDRKFVLVKEGIGSKIDEGLKWLREADGGRFRPLYDMAMAKFDYLARARLLEAIKAEDSIEYIRAQHALGRKVIVFYEYNEGGGFSPFQFAEGHEDDKLTVSVAKDGRVTQQEVSRNDLIRAFRKERSDLAAIDTGRLASPVATLTRAFPQAGVYNGMAEYKKTRMAALAAFNSDDRPDANLLLVQAAANSGWSGHDTSGKFQRVLINLGLPTAPTKAIQQEGRIYRVGQVSDALFRYFNTGTAWERSTFAGTIARRASTAENLAMGEQARALLTSFVDAFEASDTYPPSRDEGRGGKAGDRAMLSALTDYDRARAFYFGQQQKTARTKAAEGADYFATPEPVGAKMVEWLGAREGDSLLEPSAGHGAIARWMPDNTARTVVEPSMELASRLALVTDAKMVNDTFESLNIVNKFDGIAMNPPFGVGGKLAVEHLDKAYRHLREGGRIVALIPTGPAADKRFDAWYHEEGVEEKARQRGAAHLLADVRLPAVTFERAGTSVATRIVVIDKVSDDSVPTPLPRHIDLTDAADINHLFDRLQDIDMGPRAPRAEAALASAAPAKSDASSLDNEGAVATEGETPTYAVRNGKLVTNAPWATYTTEKGKALRGVYVADREIAKSVDQFTFRPKGQTGFFVREKHVVRPDADTPVFSRAPATDTEAFRRWFGDSKVTRGGQPAVIYHSSDASFTTFDKERLGSNTGHASSGLGFFLTPDRQTSERYGQHLMPVYVRMENPYRMGVDEFSGFGSVADATRRREELQAQGHDGVYVQANQTVIVFEPNQIKSATANRGAFDNGNPDILMSRGAAGARLQAADLRAMIDPIQAKWTNGPKGGVEVVQSVDDLPPHLAEYVRSAEGGSEQGFYLPKSDKVFLIADHLPSLDRAQAVVFHEVYGHKGMRAILPGEQYAEMMTRIRRANPVIARAAQAWYDQYGVDSLMMYRESGQTSAEAVRTVELLAVEEALADMASSVPVAGPVRKLLAALQAGLRKIGLHAVADWLEGRTEAETFALLRAARESVFGQVREAGIHVASAAPAFARGEETVDLPDAIIGSTLGSATSLPEYAAAKAGDEVSAVAVAKALVTPELVAKVRAAIDTEKPLVAGVVSIEATGRNKIPLAAAVALADSLGLEVNTDIVQANRPKRTTLGGLDRIFAAPVFEGDVVPGASYVIVDDTLTQGATFAALASHIQDGGGKVVAVVALTGKQYSARLRITPETLQHLRDKYGPIEQDFRAATGYGFDALTQSEGRYLGSYEPAQSVRDRILEAGREAVRRADEADASPLDGDDAPLFARGQQSPQHQTTLPLQGGATAAPRWQAPDPTRMDRLVYELQNRQIDLKRVQTAIRETVGAIPQQFDGYLKEEVYHGRVATRTSKFLERELRPLIEEMRSRGVSMEQLEAYLWARHATERNAQIAKINPDYPDGGSGLTDRQAADYMAGADVKDSAGEIIIKGLYQSKLQDMQDLAARVDRMTAGTNQILIQYGLETSDTIAAWSGTYKHYVPLKREDMDGVTPIGQGFSVKGSASKRALGSARKVTDILANIALAREAAITRGEKNRVTLSLYGLALTNPNADFWTTDTPPVIKAIDPATGLVVKRPDPAYKHKDNVIMLRVRGQDRSIAFNERDPRAMRIAETMKNLDVQPFGEIMGTVASATRFLAAINTQYNPVFGMLNAVRDVQAAALNLSTTPIADKRAFVLGNAPAALRAIWQAERHGNMASPWAKLYDQLQLAGGTTGYREIFRMGKDRSEALQREIDALDRKAPRKVLDYMLKWLDHYNTSIENAIRLTAFKAGLDKGMSQEHAASVAKNLTVNFNRKGRLGREMGAMYAFFNAAVQGTARMLETLDPGTRHGKVILIGGIMVGVVQALVAAAAMDDDDWEAVPEFTKQRNFIIPLGKSYAMIPMPLGFNVLPNIGRIVTDAIATGGAKWRTQLPDLLAVLLDNANPMGSGTFAQILAPTVADPIIALAENKDFTGRPIFKEDANPMRPKPGFQRSRDTASAISKGIAYGANWATGGTDYTPGLVSPTPDQLDYLFGTVAGGLGRELNKVYQTGELTAKGKDVPEYKKPIIGRFYGDFEGDTNTASRYWAVVREVNEKRNELVGRQKNGGDAAGYLADHPELKLTKAIEKTQAGLAKLNKAKDQIELNPNLREADRTVQMDAIDQQMAKMMGAVTRMAKEVKK